MSALPPPAFPTYEHLFEACARNKLKVKLHICTDPEGMDTKAETYLPGVRMDDFMAGHEAEHIDPPTGRHVPRTLTFFVEVWDGKVCACSGDFGPALKGPIAVCSLRRMAGVLIAAARAQPRDFPHLRP